MKQHQKRVLLLFDYNEHRLIRGIERFAQEHRWSISNDGIQRRVPWGWKGDGILAWLAQQSDEMAQFVTRTGAPTVDLNFARPELEIPRVIFDNIQISKLVADHFLGRGIRNFAFYNEDDIWTHNERAVAFIDAVRLAGHECTWLCWNRAPTHRRTHRVDEWGLRRRWLTNQLKKLPKPLGVFAAVDRLAVEILECCENAGIMVPDEVAVAGSGNYLLAVEIMPVPVTTVDPNFEGMGYGGAELLNALMNGEEPPKAPIRWPPAGLIIRRSTDLFAGNNEAVARSLRFMWEHYRDRIRVADLARMAGMSLRGYYKAVQNQIGRSPRHELQRIRMERAKLLITLSAEKAESIAKSCGFESYNAFWASFSKTTGMSPKEYRTKFSGTMSHSSRPELLRKKSTVSR